MILLPTIPVEVETRKNVFISQSRAGMRKTVSKSGAVRFYTLNFNTRDQDEYLEKLGEYTANYPGTAFSWTNTDLGASGYHYFNSELKATVDNPNTFTYSIEVRARDALTVVDPETTVFPYKPNFAYDITNARKVLINESISFARVGASTSDVARQFQYTFRNRTLAELQAAENFWAFHYPQNEITFSDDTFDEEMTFFFDSNFKWTVNSVDLIDYTFVFTEILSAGSVTGAVPADPSSLTAEAVSSSQINLTWSDNSASEIGFSIERCDGSGCTDFTQIATTSHDQEAYNDTGLLPDTLYRYRVRAFNSVGDSGYTNIAEDITDALPLGLPSDTFNRANSATTLNTSSSGHSWVVPFNPSGFGTWGILSNMAYLPSGSNVSIAYIDSGVSDCTVQCTLKTSDGLGATYRQGLVFRFVNYQNYLHFYWLASGALRCYKVVEGVSTMLDTQNLSSTEGNVLKVTLSGDQIKLYRDGTLLNTITESFNQTATKHGLYWEVGINADTHARWEDFSVVQP